MAVDDRQLVRGRGVGLGPELAGANSLDAGTVRLVGPPLGAALPVWFGLPAVITLDTASHLISALGA